MYAKLRQWWPLVKVVFCLALAFFIGRLFYKDLPWTELWQIARDPRRFPWLVLSGVLYLLGFGCSAFYWRRLLQALHQAPSVAATVRAYYVGQLGKYVPGKAWALFMRASLIHAAGVRPGLATLTSFYEVLTTMASGALVALVLFGVFGADTSVLGDWNSLWQMLRLDFPEGTMVDRKVSMLASFLFLCAIGIPILPPLFNHLVHHVSLPFRDKMTVVPRFKMATFVEGLAVTSVGWLLLGASLLAVLHGILGAELAWTWEIAGRIVAIVGLAYVSGFIILFMPGGIGAREYVLVLFLTPELMALLNADSDKARALAMMASVVLRSVWTVSEFVFVGLVYWLPVKKIEVAKPQAAGETS
jgi:uncharacterized membrane protein YbhN (UPF0104 family)